ncbi:hypothetical protein CASFOL_021699 [Castilleja foliolosa]|uniref:Uncharacterized protein n=1 Tax=Castilleja foliolosa TaxID=1961234 RepID=A0ABD3D125_9LAMI
MESRNCCTGCRGVNNVYSCSNPVRRATVYPAVSVKPESKVVKKEDEIKVTATNEFTTVVVKKEEDVKVKVGA